MAVEIINESGEPDIDGEHKTYDLLIECEGHRYWKFGRTTKRLSKRFRGEPSTTCITIRQLWRHQNERRAESHESGLFRRHKGDRPFIGKMGPLTTGGNTEIYSHDVANGEPGPDVFNVMLIGPNGWSDALSCYVDFDPYSRWATQYSWVEAALAPQFDAYLVREKSDDSKITVCSVEALERIASSRGYVGRIPRRAAERALEEACWVSDYASAYRKVTTGSPYLPPPIILSRWGL